MAFRPNSATQTTMGRAVFGHNPTMYDRLRANEMMMEVQPPDLRDTQGIPSPETRDPRGLGSPPATSVGYKNRSVTATTIAQVVAAEMSYKGTQAAQWGDALGIASTIANRAKAYGVSPESIVSAPGQYSAYGRAMPKGVGAAQIARAQKALDTIAQHGPVTPATHYARPEATKNIKGWSSFKQVDQIPGSHVFAVDEQMRPIRTATGTIAAQPNAFEGLINSARVGATAVAQSVANIPEAAASMMQQGYDVATGRVVGRNTFPAAPGLPGVNQVSGLLGLRGPMKGIEGVTIHHTGKMPPGATVDDVVNVLNTRKDKHGNTVHYGAHFVVDPQGVVHQIAPMGTKVWHMKNDVRGLGLGNQNMIGIEVMAPDDKNVSSLSAQATMGLVDQIAGAVNNPNFSVYGHGFLNTHKDAMEGNTIAKAWNDAQIAKTKAPELARREALENIKDATAPQPPPEQPIASMFPPSEPKPAPAMPAVQQADPATMQGFREALAQDKMTREVGPTQRFAPGATAAPPSTFPARPDVPAQISAQPYGAPKPAGFAPTTRTMLAPETRGLSFSPTPETMSRMLAQPVAPTRFEAPAAPAAPTATQARVGTGAYTQAPPQPAAERFAPAPAAPQTRAIASAPASIASMPMQPQAPGQFALGNATMTPTLTAPEAAPPAPAAQPSLVETGAVLAGQPAPPLPAPKVIADRPVAETVQTVKREVAAPTIAPVAPPPEQPGGLLGALRNAAMATPYGKMFKGLAALAGPTPNPKSFDYGTGAQAINDALSGATQSKPGAVSYSKSTPGYSIKSLGNGMVEKTNQYGAKSYEHVGTPGSGIFSGQPQPGGLLGGFGLSGVGPAVGGFFNAMNSPMGNMGSGFGNTANVGGTQMGFAGPWGAGTPTGLGAIGSGIGKALGGLGSMFGGGSATASAASSSGKKSGSGSGKSSSGIGGGPRSR